MTQVLDHGYVKLVESWGSDESIICAARMSTNKSFLGWGPRPCKSCEVGQPVPNPGCSKCGDSLEVPGDEKLLRYLWEHKHSTPFEMAGVVIEVQAPIFVFREWHRHRTQSFSELSARYTEVPELFYVPSVERLRNGGQSKTNKQASGAELPSEVVLEGALIIEQAGKQAFAEYRRLLELGFSREISRGVLHFNTYSRMRASANLRNWLGFLTLRLDSAAQWEMRQFANAVADIVAEKFPRTWALFQEGQE